MVESVILSTRNAHKIREFDRLLNGLQVSALPEDIELPPETGDSFVANALIKARAAANATDQVAIADDSGIGASVLNWKPGIYSARYAGEHATDEENLAKFITEVPAGEDIAYTCVIAYVDPINGVEKTFEGRCNGKMASVQSGNRGFGYDPVFIPEIGDGAKTMADLTDEEKDLVGHRGQAARLLLQWLQ